jgi:hypothetical protein
MMIRHRIIETREGTVVRLIYDGYSRTQAAHDFEHAKSMGIAYPNQLRWMHNGNVYKCYQANKIAS